MIEEYIPMVQLPNGSQKLVLYSDIIANNYKQLDLKTELNNIQYMPFNSETGKLSGQKSVSFQLLRLKKFLFHKINNKTTNSSEKNNNPTKFKSVEAISALLNLPESAMTNTVQSDAIDKINKNQEKYLFIIQI